MPIRRPSDFAGCHSGGVNGAGDLRWSKWSFWVLHATLFCVVYAAILVVPRTQWRVRRALINFAYTIPPVHTTVCLCRSCVDQHVPA